MNPFSISINELSEAFGTFGIPTDDPGFCDHPSFLALEQRNPELLNLYATYVARRTYTDQYLRQAELKIKSAAQSLHRELVDHGRLGACVDISGILSRILDREGIWNTCVKGSLTITFPANSGIPPRYFWSCDTGEFVAGHAWLFAPPFTVVDISARQQPYEGLESSFVPEYVLSKVAEPAEVSVDDIVSPEVRIIMTQQGIPAEQHLGAGARYVPEIFSAISPILVSGLEGASLKYSPVAIHAPDCALEDMRNMDFSGQTPWELYEAKIREEIASDA